MERIKTVSIVGMGALGVMFGEFFAQKLGWEAVTFIADKHRIAKYREEGIYANGKACSFTYSDGSASDKAADLLIFAVKGTALNQAIRQAEKLVGKSTIILSFLNGIVSEEIIRAAYDTGHVLYCVAQGMDAVKLGNQLNYTNFGQLCIGCQTEEPAEQEAFKKVKDFFDYIGMPYMVDDDMRRRLWSKWMLNVGVNQVVMVEQGNYGTIQCSGKPREMMLGAMREVMTLAELEGILLTEEDLNHYVALIDSLNPEGMPSMRQDGVGKRPSEVEFFAGTVLDKARKCGLETPINKKLYQRIKEIETNYR